ncbi:MAG: LysE family translocator [Thermoleophilaceae bacterium]
MPEPATLIVFALAALALIAVPGPNLIYIATSSISNGRRAGLVSVLGVETGTLLHVAAAAAGLSALLASSAVAFGFVKYAGAAYLVYLGIRTLLTKDDDVVSAEPGGRRSASLGRTYRQAVVVQLLNPKVALFFLAFLPQFVDPARGSAAVQVLVLGAIVTTLGVCVSSLYGLAAGAAGGRLRARAGFARKQRYATGAVYLGLGAAAALTGSRR